MAVGSAMLQNNNEEISDYDFSDDDNEARLFSADGKEVKKKSGFHKVVEGVKKKVKKHFLRLFLLVLFNGLYLYLGGLCFYFLERNERPVHDTTKHAEMILKAIQDSNITLTSDSDVTKVLTMEGTQRIDDVIRAVIEQRNSVNQTDWTVASSVFFASTVVTTIGYGNLAPVTFWGRLFCVVYAIVGIPLTLMLLTMVGSMLSSYINNFCGVIVRNVQKYLYPDYQYESTNGLSDLNTPVWLAVTFIMLFISLDATVFMYMEGWSFMTSLYFIFITLTTIGFGDIVPLDSKAVWFNVTFLYIGLAAVSITINLFIANISIQYRKHREKLKFVRKLEEELGEEENTPLVKDEKTDQLKDRKHKN